MKAIELREKINTQVIAAPESGDVLPWERPWRLGKNAGASKNVVSKNAYKGINTLILDLASMRHNLTSCWWGTWLLFFATVKTFSSGLRDFVVAFTPGRR